MTKLDKFIEQLKNIFGSRLKSVFVYGAKAGEKADNLLQDVDLMVLVTDLHGEDIKKCSKPAREWMGKSFIFCSKRNSLPVFMGEKEWYNSSDVYAMEYSDIKENHKILYGEDLICNINVNRDDLRLQCEAETKNLLMQFRAHYLMNAHSHIMLQKSLVPLTKTLNAIFKAILRIKNIEVSKSPYENLNKIHSLFAINKSFYEKLLCHKEKHCTLNKKEAIDTADTAVAELQKLLDYVNNL